ncbi:[citrate (pro-3S)-lyase] ligase [Enterococcus caccae]|uniref:[Citrate [pro-3S]-lyase] ligase n=1 Tax=Enterococcus caccae ATCC BAA-1240 TaxID=1158612 RepID=R3WE61_9ENTE|nr:[citrate (pro-3S)-lyase] ligase [Enterococcus caccae]EOL45747.1 [citrate (Pro-3S)-lyase] ligase [Enterococcus caccae ATCC BAA-1240]EOT60943.1 [citrate (Pro-3S)-lyase] ligase [Enterococcus caccae ATCC BAA-1240]OJG28019.1 [citrate (Pro-3S)-lyase] ligase [Enterococcus caccae]
MNIRRIWLDRDFAAKQQWSDFLINADLIPDDQLDYTIGIYDQEKLIGTGSIFRNILKCIAIDSSYQNENLLSQIVQALRERLQETGYQHYFLYTKPKTSKLFRSLGFTEIAATAELVFMEQGFPDFEDYLVELKKHQQMTEQNAAIVMNANPFTNGHLYLVTEAAKCAQTVYLFVLSEERSLFDAKTRFKLVKEGVKHLSNVVVLPTREYMVSSATFPSYFLKNQAKENIARVQAELDATLFKEKIAPVLNITKRFVGEEPLSPVTNIYNQAMENVFSSALNLIILPRKKVDDEVISASRVRALMKEQAYEEIKSLVPNSTFKEIMNQKKE